MYLFTYIVHEYFTVFTIFLSTLSLYLGTLGAAKYLHNSLLRNVLRSPMTTFFDVTPIGRILNRFSHDVEVVDNEFPGTIRAFTSCFFGVKKNKNLI